jgi:putative acetyltransferase
MRPDLLIRPEQAADAAAVRSILREAFTGEQEAKLVDTLRDNDKAIAALVAEKEGHIVGHILFSPVIIESAQQVIKGAGLAPLAVLPAEQRQGIGSMLIKQGIGTCRSLQLDYLVVLGQPEYYGRFGFAPASRFGFGNDFGVDEEFMLLELRPGCLQGASGKIQYGVEFLALSSA